ncbi:DUF4833 domain-containing protein [Mucilaginibacter sp. UR6-1]|uniref:DUF4833 domain-containing protein n=1 Tax=Mucilaginibacter sp. UR6-1 TaxID=1435643 RepID=UPI001E5E19C3|nr:DUF4833 domain-containing protein [Mucilaginibacter sp. UR6-1]MCC8407867.1 DUF4833 domain-containing protein [Mucilaginibacter sp. UR6-1]
MRILLTLLFLGTYLMLAGNSKVSYFYTSPADTLKIAELPTPTGIEMLFYLQRDPNTNTIIYELNWQKDGTLDVEDPIHPYWKLYAKQQQCVELSMIQRKFAFGIDATPLGKEKYDIRILSYKKIPLTLMKGTDGKYHIFVTILNRQAILNRIFVRIDGGAVWSPNVKYMELKGTDIATGKEVAERLKP